MDSYSILTGIPDLDDEARSRLRTKVALHRELQAVEGDPVGVWRRASDLVLPDQRISRIHRLENIRRVYLNRFSSVRPQLVLNTIGNVGDERSTQKNTVVPTDQK